MSKRSQIDTSNDLERRLSQSIDKMRESITRSHAMRQQIIKLRKQRRQVEAVPDDVKRWFEETAEFLDDEEEEEERE